MMETLADKIRLMHERMAAHTSVARRRAYEAAAQKRSGDPNSARPAPAPANEGKLPANTPAKP